MRIPPFSRKALPIAIAALSLTLGGCFDSNDDSLGSNDEITNVSLAGVVAKGIIKGGIVTAEELDSSGTSIRTVGEATTGDDGSYDLELDSAYEGGPIQITISTDADTQMKCDIPADCGTRSDDIADNDTDVNFGEWYKPGSGSLTMTALVAEADSGSSLSVNVTPYTDLAARRAKASGTVDAAAIYSANSEVSNLLGGIDILATKPIDITDTTSITNGSPTEIAYAAFGAAIAALADTTQGAPDLSAALDTLESSFTDGQIVADDEGSTANFSLQEIIDAAQETYTEIGVVDTSSVLVSLQDDVDSAGVGGVVDPVASETAGSAALTKVKAAISDLRTWGTVIDAEMDVKGTAFDEQVLLAEEISEFTIEFLLDPAFEAAVEAIVVNVLGGGNGNLSDYGKLLVGSDYFEDGVSFSSGSISRTGSTITITDGVINEFTINMTVEAPVDGASVSNLVIGISSATFRSASIDADIDEGTIVATLDSTYAIDYAALDAGIVGDPTITDLVIDLDLSVTQKIDVSFSEALAGEVAFNGVLSTTLTNPVDDSEGELAWMTPSTLELSGEISSSAGHSMVASFTANIANAATFEPVGELAEGTVTLGLVSWTVSDTDDVLGNDTFVMTGPDFSYTAYWSALTNQVHYTSTYEWDYGWWGDSEIYSYSGSLSRINSLTAHIVSKYSWGTYAYADAGEYFVDFDNADFSQNGNASGVLQWPEFVLENEADDIWLDADIGLNFTLQLDGLPEASVSITGDRSGFDDGIATITIAYGARQIVVNGTIADGESTGNVVITNQDNVSITLTPNDDDSEAGTITYNGTKYADIVTLESGAVKISYTDGSFEIL